MRAHIVRSRGQVAVHGRTPAVAALECPRQQCWSLTCVLGPQQTAAVATAAACCCLIQSSQRCSEACRIRAVLSLLRLSAFEPVDRSWMVPRVSLRRGVLAMAGRPSVRWRAERATKQREKHGSDAMSQNVRSGSPRAGPSLQKVEGKESCMRSHWLVVRPFKACPDETGHRQQASPSWSSDIHNCLSCLCRGRTVRRGVPVHILLEKPAKGLLHIC